MSRFDLIPQPNQGASGSDVRDAEVEACDAITCRLGDVDIDLADEAEFSLAIAEVFIPPDVMQQPV